MQPNIIESPHRQPLIVTQREDGWLLKSGRTYLLLSTDQVDQFISLVTGRPRIQRYACR